MSHSGFTGWHNPCLAFASSNPQTETHGRWPRGRRDITQMQADTNSEKLNYKHKYTFWNKYNWLGDTNASRYKFYFNCFPFIDDAGPTAFKYFPQVKIPPRNDSTRKDKQTSGKIEQMKCPKKFFRTNHLQLEPPIENETPWASSSRPSYLMNAASVHFQIPKKIFPGVFLMDFFSSKIARCLLWTVIQIIFSPYLRKAFVITVRWSRNWTGLR